MYQSLRQQWEQWRRHYPFWRRRVSPSVEQPLVDAATLAELERHAQSLPWSLIGFERPASHPLVGEALSAYRGRGLEFVENRAYQPGDEPRLLNWRLYARAGQLYTKVFAEERRPQVFLLVDRRAAMRFGTRRQLKVTLAVKIALSYAFQARQQGLAVGGLILDAAPDWYPPALGEAATQAFLQSLASGCPPLDFGSDQPEFEESLHGLSHRVPSGCFVLLVSDFSDLDPDRAMGSLHRLAAQHTVTAIQILDPVERQLPTGGDFLIEDAEARQPLRVYGRDTRQHARYAQAFRERQDTLAACFRASRIPLTTCITEDDLDACLEPFHVAHGHG